MSKVQLQGNASGTGIFTIASPNSNTDRTLTLPDNTGTLLTSGSAIQRSQLPAGSVLQVVQAFSNSQHTTTSSTFQATTHSVTITPQFASSKILLLHQGMVNSLAGSVWCWAAIFRNASVNLYSGGAYDSAGGIYTNSSPDSHCPITFSTLDSPNTTSATTYTIYFKNNNNSSSVRYNADAWRLYFIAMEIAG